MPLPCNNQPINQTTNRIKQVYVPDADAAWARASVLSKTGDTVYEVRIDGIDDNNEGGTSDWGAGDVRRVDLAGEPRCARRTLCSSSAVLAAMADSTTAVLLYVSRPTLTHDGIVYCLRWCSMSRAVLVVITRSAVPVEAIFFSNGRLGGNVLAHTNMAVPEHIVQCSGETPVLGSQNCPDCGRRLRGFYQKCEKYTNIFSV